MTQTTVTQEGCFDLGARTAINNNFTQLLAGTAATPFSATV